MAKIKITQIKSKNGATKRQIANLQSLGIHRMHQTVEVCRGGAYSCQQRDAGEGPSSCNCRGN